MTETATTKSAGPAAAAAPPRPVARSRWRNSDTRAAYLFLSPAIVGFLVLVGYPLVRSAYISMTDSNGLTPARFVGLDNYRRMFFDDPSFWPSIRATALLLVLYVPLAVTLGLALALMCNRPRRGVTWLRTACYLPVVLPVVATITLWKFVFNPDVGLANTVLRALHLPTSDWLSSSSVALPSVVIVMLWSVGATMVIFLAALQAVPGEIYESARMDGASAWSQFWRITLPLIRPIIVLQVVLQVTTALQTFNQPKILTGGGPGFSTDVLMLSIYDNAFASLGSLPQRGYAAAQSWVLLLAVVIVVAASARFSSVWRYRDVRT